MTTGTGMTRRGVLAGLLAGIAAPAFAEGAIPKIRPMPRGRTARPELTPVEGLIAAAKLGGVTGFVVADAATGRIIEALAPDAPVPPASVAKTITTLFALEKLGEAHRFRTEVLATGPIRDGRVEGDLILRGGGDPTLDTDRLGDLVAQLAAAGVRSVGGRFLAHDGALPEIGLIDPGQPEYVGYNPSISGLNLNFNRVNFEWKQSPDGYALSMDARGERFLPPVAMARVAAVDREAPLFTYEGGPGEDRWTVAVKALGKGGSRWLPVRHPALYAAEVFQTLARAQGVTLPRAEVVRAHDAAGARLVVAHESEPLADVLRDMLRFSTNLTAEVVGLTASGRGDLGASAAAMTEWAAARLGMGSRFVDHSGLGAGSTTTAADMVRALVAARHTATGPALPGLLRDIGIRDEAGKTIKNHPVRVVAKSGTLNFVSGLAGYIQPPDRATLAFAVFSADVARRDRLSPAEREQPEGGQAWTKRARGLQGRLIARWAELAA